MTGLINTFICGLSCIPNWIYVTLARFVVGMTFFKSGLTKVDENYAVLSKTKSLFNDIYFKDLPLPEGVIDFLAVIATYAELSLPILLWIGLGSRFAAIGLLIMTAVIQIFVFPGSYVVHGLWAVALLTIIVNGAGPLSLDYLIKKSRG
jgi:putative oxidoreductase